MGRLGPTVEKSTKFVELESMCYFQVSIMDWLLFCDVGILLMNYSINKIFFLFFLFLMFWIGYFFDMGVFEIQELKNSEIFKVPKQIKTHVSIC